MAKKSTPSYMEKISDAIATIRASLVTMRSDSEYRKNIARLTDSIEVELHRYDTELTETGKEIICIDEEGHVEHIEKWKADLLRLHGLKPEMWEKYRDAAQELYASQLPNGLIPKMMRKCGLVDALGLTPAKEAKNNG